MTSKVPDYSGLFMATSTMQDMEEEAAYFRKSPNIRFLPCGLSFVKNSTGYISLSCIVFGWAYATYFVPTIILWPKFNEDQIGYLPIILFYTFSLLTVVSLFRASTTDPGWVPFDFKSTTVDKVNWTHCTQCLVQRPVKSHHCSKCQRCVRKMDHHCHWINKCVAEDNQWLFLLLVLYGALLSAFTMLYLVLHFYYYPSCTLCDKTSFPHYYTLYLMYGQFVQGCCLLSICTSQLIVQTANILMNRTTVESIIHANTPVQDRQPLNTSGRALFEEVCGGGPLLCWLNPFRRRRRRPHVYYNQLHV